MLEEELELDELLRLKELELLDELLEELEELIDGVASVRCHLPRVHVDADNCPARPFCHGFASCMA